MNKAIVEKFKNWLIVEGQSENTVKTYSKRITEFLKHIKNKKINQKTVNDFMLFLRKNYKNSTVNLYKYSLKSFIKFLNKNIKLPKDMKKSKKLPSYFSEDFFLNELIPDLEIIRERKVLKIKTVLYFMFYTGIRLQEIINLKRNHIDLNKKEALIIGKGDKERKVLFNEETKDLLKKYFSIEPEENNAFNYTYHGLQNCIKQIGKMYNIKITPHVFRHSFAINLLKKGFNIEMIRRLLGHSDISTTAIYLKATIDDIAKFYHKKI